MKRHDDIAESIIKLEGLAFALACFACREVPSARAMLKTRIVLELERESGQLRAEVSEPLPGLVEILRSTANDCENMERWATPELAPLLRRAADVIEGGVSPVTPSPSRRHGPCC